MILCRWMRSAVAGLLVAAVAAAPVLAQQAKPAQTAQAQHAAGDPGGLRIGVLDLEEINQKAAVFKSIRAQMEQYNTAFSEAIRSEDAELGKANQELARQRTILSPEAFAEERRKFEQNVTNFQRQVERRKQNLNTVHAKAVMEAENALLKVIAEFAQEHSVALVLRRDTIVFYNKAMDMTAIILERLDKAMPTIKVSQPEK